MNRALKTMLFQFSYHGRLTDIEVSSHLAGCPTVILCLEQESSFDLVKRGGEIDRLVVYSIRLQKQLLGMAFIDSVQDVTVDTIFIAEHHSIFQNILQLSGVAWKRIVL